MRFAYADPPYLGMGNRYHHPDARRWDELEAHAELIASLQEYDGWALSLHVPSLRELLPLVPADVRICSWVKTFAAFNPGVTQAYTWEPVFVRPVRKRPVSQPTVRDWVACRIAFEKGTYGAKPREFADWLFSFAGLQAGDEFIDLFPGSGAMTRAWEAWRAQAPLWEEPAKMEPAELGL